MDVHPIKNVSIGIDPYPYHVDWVDWVCVSVKIGPLLIIVRDC